ncbi:hypothetical protein IRT45_09745 [Nocardia sp. BSTN01]|uniref:hypothetical protein n=1 Tax=Nocardia sp. BSTN01 TaxID=2783665 RepID=UPI00188E9CA8|nr:hypothetical protein [Nocardia sp. BSTN01]MBF4997441.1 hypothetical protein [Nocardia sp. BSTN01]
MVRNDLPSKLRTRMSRTVITVAIAAAPIVAAAAPALAEPAAPARSQEVQTPGTDIQFVHGWGHHGGWGGYHGGWGMPGWGLPRGGYGGFYPGWYSPWTGGGYGYGYGYGYSPFSSGSAA